MFGRAVNRVFDILALSVLHVLLCVPIVTIGGAGTALYRVCGQWAQGEDASAADYLRIFRAEWRSGIPLGLLVSAVAAVLLIDARICGMERCPMPVRVLGLGVILFVSALFAHIFLNSAMFRATAAQTVGNACLLALLHPLRNLCAAAAAVLILPPALRAYIIARIHRKTYRELRAAYADGAIGRQP